MKNPLKLLFFTTAIFLACNSRCNTTSVQTISPQIDVEKEIKEIKEAEVEKINNKKMTKKMERRMKRKMKREKRIERRKTRKKNDFGKTVKKIAFNTAKGAAIAAGGGLLLGSCFVLGFIGGITFITAMITGC